MIEALGFVVPLLILGAVVVGIVVLTRRILKRREEAGGADVIAYLLLALAVGTAVFALAELAEAAFPGSDTFVGDTSQRVAASLAGLVVAGPIAGFLWRRQSQRRVSYPRSAGWTVYLMLMEVVFMTALVLSVIALLRWAFGDEPRPTWTNALVFGGVVAFHEWAARRTPPASDAAELPRVVGSAIGLIATAVGAAGVLYWLFAQIYATLAPTVGGPELGTWMSILLVGAPVWWFRWWRPWPASLKEPGERGYSHRAALAGLMAVIGLVTFVGSTAVVIHSVLIFMFTDTPAAGIHFEPFPLELSLGIVGALVWAHHRGQLGTERTDPVRAYGYLMAAIGLATTIGSATGLTSMAFRTRTLVRPSTEGVIAVAIALVTGAAVWLWFWLRASASPRESEAASAPRRFYLLGLGVVTGLVAAGALIASLVVAFQQLLGADADLDTLVVQAFLFVYSGLATWHLIRTNVQDRELLGSEEVISPFSVTIVCSHPGMIATRFPKVAKLKVVYRGDGIGQIDESMAAEIVAAVDNKPSLVWVDEDGFRVAPAMK